MQRALQTVLGLFGQRGSFESNDSSAGGAGGSSNTGADASSNTGAGASSSTGAGGSSSTGAGDGGAGGVQQNLSLTLACCDLASPLWLQNHTKNTE